MKKVELLSPVGNSEMLYQAIHNGADAVYLAGTSYGARKFAANFDKEELIEAIKYSHLYGVLVYVTVNTMIYEREVEDFLSYIGFLYKNGVDAVIMQDIGMISLVHEKFPDLEIHASTQCHNHNQEGIQLLKNLGCKRVVMAREMSIDEIKELDVLVEKEVFVYGALCVSYSGCCLFSSLNGGRSGNRGECVGSCRLPYKLVRNGEVVSLKDKFLLSTKDLNTLDNLCELLDSGIDSLKIEGRMKSPAYVGYVTRLYRTLIDKYYHGEEIKLTEVELKNLKGLFNREFTKGYLFHDQDIMNIKSPNHLGNRVGRVIKTDSKFIYAIAEEELHQEDGIRFFNADKGMVINRLYNEKHLLVNKVEVGQKFLLDNKLGLRRDDVILRTIDSRFIKELELYSLKKIEVSIKANFQVGKPFVILIKDGKYEVTLEGEIVEKALKRAVTKDEIERCFGKLGNTPFICKSMEIESEENIFVNLKSLNEARRELVERLIRLREYSYRDGVSVDLSLDTKSDEMLETYNKEIHVLVRDEEQLKACLEEQVSSIYVIDENLYQKYRERGNVYYRGERVLKHYPKRHDEKLVATEIGSVGKYGADNDLIGDYFLNVANHHSVLLLKRLGVKRVTLSVELDKEKIADIVRYTKNVEVVVYGRLELMVMKYCPLKKCLNYCDKCRLSNEKFALEDKFGNRYPMVRNHCLTHIMHYKNIDLLTEVEEYIKMGIVHYRLELFDESESQTRELIRRLKKQIDIGIEE